MQRNLAWPSVAYWFAPVGAVAAGGAAPVVALGCAGCGCGACVCCCVGNSVGCAVAALPARQSATKALSVTPLAWLASLFARHSSVQALTVFWPVAAGAAAAVVFCAGAAGAACFGAAPPRHCVTKALSWVPLAWLASLFACHSFVQAATVFSCATAGTDRSIAPMTAPTTTVVRIFNS